MSIKETQFIIYEDYEPDLVGVACEDGVRHAYITDKNEWFMETNGREPSREYLVTVIVERMK